MLVPTGLKADRATSVPSEGTPLKGGGPPGGEVDGGDHGRVDDPLGVAVAESLPAFSVLHGLPAGLFTASTTWPAGVTATELQL